MPWPGEWSGSDQELARCSRSDDGDTLAGAAKFEQSAAAGLDGDESDDTADSAGALYVFTRDGSGDWSQRACVKASNTDVGDQFGDDFALSGDGRTLAIASQQEDSGAVGIGGDQSDNSRSRSGAVYLY